MVEHFHELMHRVHIGNKKKCVVLSVYLDESDPACRQRGTKSDPTYRQRGTKSDPTYRQRGTKSDPNIDGIGYDGNLLRNSGTIHMIKSAMAFVVKYYEKYNFSKFQFKDTSLIPCEKDYQMPLSVYYVAKHGKTWHEMKLGAKPIHETEFQKYVEEKRLLQNDLKTPIQDHKQVYNKLMANVPKNKKQALFSFFEKSKTKKEFLKHLFDEYDCFVFKYWLSSYILQFIPNIMRMEWVIEHSPDFHIQIESLKEKPEDLFMIGGVSDLPHGYI